jgi:hypothetical protein
MKSIKKIPYTAGRDVRLAQFQELDTVLLDFINATRFAGYVRSNEIKGKITLLITIDESGKVTTIEPGPLSQNEFEGRLIKELEGLGAATPANISGKYVKCQKSVQIIFANGLLYASVSSSSGKKLNKRNVSDFKDDKKDVMPEFPGGTYEMMRHIQKNVRYPKTAVKADLSGKCFMRFVVSKNGLIKNVNIIRGVPNCIECDVEATRVVYLMPNWKPGTQDGKRVHVFFNQPINFQLK